MAWLFFIFINASYGQGLGAQSVFDGLRRIVPESCLPASTLRVCFNVNKETCENRVQGAFETCLRDQRIKFAGTTSFDPQMATAVENSLKACVLENYAMTSMTSYRKTPACEQAVPKPKQLAATKNRAIKPVRRTEDTAFEDPLDGQRDMLGRYRLRLLHDLRMTKRLKEDLFARKICLNDKQRRETNLNCFKRALQAFTITSSVQITELASLAVLMAIKDKEQGIPPSQAQLADAVLLATERIQLDEFHLGNLQTTNDSDRVMLNQLRVDDEKLLKSTTDRVHLVLQAKLDESARRAPASLGDLKLRMETLKGRRWRYPSPH